MTTGLGRRTHAAMWGVWAALMCHCVPGLAANYALLVGVSEYPNLAPALQLEAPANDVRLMRQVLLQRGFEASRIELLADGVDGAKLPTRGAIVASLQGLRARVRPGDVVYLHFAGHGSLQRAGNSHTGATTPTDSKWQPIFLPRDVSGWEGKSETVVANAITDTTLRSELDRINDAGAFVFAVFDACHSSRLVRGAAPLDSALMHQRYVMPQTLGLGDGPGAEVLPVWSAQAPPPAAEVGPRGRAVYFYASQSFELAQSLPLSNGGRPEWHGLFSWNIAQALALGQPVTYRQLAQHILSRYDQLPATTATPLFSGDGLDQWVFGQERGAIRQWPLERVEGQIVVPAGALSGLVEGALFALVSDPLAAVPKESLQPPQGTLGFVKLIKLGAQRSLLEPVAWQQWAAPSPQTLLPGVWARLMVNPPSFSLRVSDDLSECKRGCVAGEAVARLVHDGVPGVDVRWVGRDDSPDVTLRSTPRGVRLLLPGDSAVATDGWGYASVQEGNADHATDTLAEEVAIALHRVASTRNLLRLGASLALRPPQADVDLTLTVTRTGEPAPVKARVDQITSVSPGDLVTVQGRNAIGDPLDVAAFWLGADQSIRQIYPLDARDTSRLAAGESLRRFGVKVDPGSVGTERILVLTMPMARGREAGDFRFLEQSALSRLRGGGSDTEIQALIDACFADYRVRGAASPALPPERLGMRVYTFDVRP